MNLPPLTRRSFLTQAAALWMAAATPPVWARPRFTASPFTLGVASGYPEADGVVLWTRLAPEPLAPGGGMPAALVKVRYEVACDADFRVIALQGHAWAEPAFAHTVHVETRGLAPGRPYWYRFHAADATSPVGRTRTAPTPKTPLETLRFAYASCQQYEQGYYGAYRHMAADDLDLVIHLGDYIYERTWGERFVRPHEGPEPITLDDYRARYACYKRDPNLQAAHAAAPWVAVWDDHEVENDYAGERSENLDDPRWFLLRRAAAYRAWYEHLPVRRTMMPLGPDARIYTRLRFGTLAEISLLDDRQYRTAQVCPKPGRGGGNRVKASAARLDPKATLLGGQQEAWLAAGLEASQSRWNVLAQQTLMAQADLEIGPGQVFSTDGWDGYPAARQRLLDAVVASKATNPIVISGDVHSYWVSDLKQDFDRPDSPTVATEICGTSITSRPPPEERIQDACKEGPHIRFATGVYRGYTRMTVTPETLTADLRVVADVRDPDTTVRTLATFVVSDGRPGAEQV